MTEQDSNQMKKDEGVTQEEETQPSSPSATASPEPEDTTDEVYGSEASSNPENTDAKEETGDTNPTNEESSTEPKNQMENLLQQISDLQEQVKSHKEDMLRGRAELENYRKRVQRDKDELRKTATSGLIEELLPVLDNMQLGLQSARNHPSAKDVTQGFEMVHNALQSTLKNHGLEEIHPLEQAFDPNYHECVAHQPSDTIPEDHVMQVVRTGYTLNQRLLRPANVVVSSGPEKAEQDASAKGQAKESENQESGQKAEGEEGREDKE